jgi:hypothetical protein
MASRLTPCPSCSRHVKVGPPSCPFCGGDVPTNVPARPVLAGRPLSRAAILFASAAAVSACSGTTRSTMSSDAAVDTGGPMPAYGVPGMPFEAGEPDDAGQPTPLYGIGPQVDAGDPIPSADASADAGADTGQGMASYGVFVNPDAGDAGQGVAAYGVFPGEDAGHDHDGDPGQGGAAYGLGPLPPAP